jgi:nicotinamidase-related amidase
MKALMAIISSCITITSTGEASMRVNRADCVLLVIDVQDRIIDTINEHVPVVQNIKALIKTAEALSVPVLSTEQENLGESVPELKGLLPQPPVRKVSFSCCGNADFMKKLTEIHKRVVIVGGIETHICVLQTALDLLEHRYRVLVVRDATSAHVALDRETALSRMADSGAIITTTEAVIYELAEKAGTDEFRRILEIVKDRRAGASK